MPFGKYILTCVIVYIIGISNNFVSGQITKIQNSNNQFRAVHWNIENGLVNGDVFFMLKDAQEFLWIGTKSGLSRFDGGTFKNYRYDPVNAKGIARTTVLGLVEDSLHNIWIGTDLGLSRYDLKADTIMNFHSTIAGNYDPFMVPFWATSDEIFCFERDSLIVSFNIHSFIKKIKAKLSPNDSIGYRLSRGHSIFDEKSNSIWMLQGFGFPGDGGLLQITLPGGQRKRYNWTCTRNIPNHSHSSEGMCYDKKRNSIWLNSPDGLVEFSLTDLAFHQVDALNELTKAKDFDKYVGIDIDRKGRIWFATAPKGIIIYDPENQRCTLPFPKDSSIQNDASFANASIYCDREGMVWSGSWLGKGFYQIAPFSPAVKRYSADKTDPFGLTNNFIHTVIRGDHGTVWFGTGDGIKIFDPNSDVFLKLVPKNILSGNPELIDPILVDASHSTALLELNGYYQMDLESKICKPVIFKDSNNHNIKIQQIYNAEPLKENCMVIASYENGKGIFIIPNGSTCAQQIASFPKWSIAEFKTKTNRDNLIFVRRRNNLRNITLEYKNNKCNQIQTPIDSIEWTRIYTSTFDKSYWVLVNGEFIHYDNQFKLLRKYTNEDGLPDLDIFGVIADKKGNIWFNTDRSIHQLNVTDGTVSSVTDKDGFLSQNFSPFSQRAMDANGDLYFPGSLYGVGFDRISTDKFNDTTACNVYLRSLSINQKTFPLHIGINSLEKLSLHYFENEISIETGVVDYYSKGKNKIRYKLENLNNDWQYAPANYTVRYAGLPAGNYRLLIQAANASNRFNGPIKSVLIQITPAFWNTWWFRILVSICLIGLVYAIIRWRLGEKYRLKLERFEKDKQLAEMQEKATKLQQATSELQMQALRSQMNPHFIFNSLNSINRFILQNNKTLASEYLTKFSKLVRLILQNSQASLIPLESEVESMKLYLELEALRFDYRFDYKISIAPELDIETIKVPPLIIQPFAENAIWHGLMHKDEKGQLDVEINMEEEYLFLKITDNGIGRAKAALMNSKSATRHKSVGLKITEERIDNLQRQGLGESKVKINDLTNSDGTAAGTEVIIKIPVIYD